MPSHIALSYFSVIWEIPPPFVLSDASMTRKRHESVMGSGSKL